MPIDDDMVDRFLSALYGLLPKGLIWVRRGGPRLARGVREDVLRGIAIEGATLCDRAAQLLLESDPRTASEMLPDWEAAVGLPEVPETDPAQQPSVEQRRAAAAQKYSAVGGASVQDMINAAAAVGFTITIEEYSAFAPAGIGSEIGDSLWDNNWAFFWLVVGPVNTIQSAGIGDEIGDSLATWGNTLLESVIRRAKPAWTAVGFSYTA